MGYFSNFVYTINVIGRFDTFIIFNSYYFYFCYLARAQGAKDSSYFKKYPNFDMYFISNNIIETSFQTKVMKCASLCSMITSCGSFVYKTDRNCTLYVANPQNTSLFIPSPDSCLYLKKY